MIPPDESNNDFFNLTCLINGFTTVAQYITILAHSWKALSRTNPLWDRLMFSNSSKSNTMTAMGGVHRRKKSWPPTMCTTWKEIEKSGFICHLSSQEKNTLIRKLIRNWKNQTNPSVWGEKSKKANQITGINKAKVALKHFVYKTKSSWESTLYWKGFQSYTKRTSVAAGFHSNQAATLTSNHLWSGSPISLY